MKKLIFLFMLLLCGTIKADYLPPTLNQLILKADKIVYGEIICVDNRVIEVRVHKGIHHNTENITIGRFVEWSCGKRWTEYQVGQTSIFFLRHRKERFIPFGGSNEGEIPIHNNRVYVHTSTISMSGDVSLFERSTRTVEDLGYNNPYNGYVINFVDFWQATEVIKKCFTSDVTATGNLVNIQQLCSAAEYESTMEENKILNWAITELKN